MTATFDSAIKKLDRALAHRDLLQHEISIFQDSNPVAISRQNKDEGSGYLIRSVVVPVPEVIPAILGDVIHNLRCCLDHLVHELADDMGVATRNTAFPIMGRRSDFEEGLSKGVQCPKCKIILGQRKWQGDGLKQIAGLPEIVGQFIMACQFARLADGTDLSRHHPTGSQLRWLKMLDDVDKHQSLHLVAVASGNLWAPSIGPGGLMFSFPTTQIQDGTVIFDSDWEVTDPRVQRPTLPGLPPAFSPLIDEMFRYMSFGGSKERADAEMKKPDHLSSEVSIQIEGRWVGVLSLLDGMFDRLINWVIKPFLAWWGPGHWPARFDSSIDSTMRWADHRPEDFSGNFGH